MKKKCGKVFDGGNCVTNFSDCCLRLEGEPRKFINSKILENILQLHAHKGSGFDTWIFLIFFLVINAFLI